MTLRPSRFLALFLTLCLMLTALPVGLPSSARAETYGVTTSGGVRLRKSPSKTGDTWFLMEEGIICTVQETTTRENILWYKVIAPGPVPESTRTYVGYIHGDYFRLMTATETAEWLSRQAQAQEMARATATPVPGTTSVPPAYDDDTPVVNTSGVIYRGGTNFRDAPSMKGHSLMKLDNGTVVEVLTVPSTNDEYHWYKIYYANQTGYVRADCLRVNGIITTATPIPGTVVTPTPYNPGTVVTATPTPGGSGIIINTPTPTPVPAGVTNYNAVQLILSSCHLRQSPGGPFDHDDDWSGIGSVLPLAGDPITQGGFIWYPVTKNGKTYYVRNDCAQLISTGSPVIPTASVITPIPEQTEIPGVLGYVMTIRGGVNLRSTIGGTVIRQVAKYRTVPYLLAPVKKSGYTWYYVEVDGNRGYLRSDVVKVVSGGATPTAGPQTTVTPVPGAAGYVMTTATNVNIRTKAGYSPTLGRIGKNEVMPYFGTPSEVKGVTWYYVRHAKLGYGYIHGGYVTLVNQDGTATTPPPGVTLAPTPIPGVDPVVTAGPGTVQREASYNTLKLGATGESVRNLVTALKAQGYYSGEITNRYTSAVQSAIRAFQRAKGLSVDGIAGEATQHALYGTVPKGTGESLLMTLYAAEKIDWWTGGINELWAKGANYKVYDVKTGIVWQAHRWSGGYHVDAEPLTASDTAKLCKCYGVTTASEIASKNLYERRPCLVTIGNRTFACSLYGVPHNYPEGDTISTNNFKGQLCIHFTNSWTHGSKKVDSLHTEAIQYAWEHAPNGHK